MANLTINILSHHELNPEQWDSFIKDSPQGGIYALHGYASAIAAEWQAAIVSKGDRWLAVMPFVSSHKFGLKYSLQPLFSQYWGVFFAPFEGNTYKKLSQQRKCLELLLPILKPYQLVKYRLSPKSEYLLPFHWDGFMLKPRFTYTLDITPTEEMLWSNLASPLQRQIKKGRKLHLAGEKITDSKVLFDLIAQQRAHGHDVLGGAKNGMAILEKVISYLQQTSMGELFAIKDEQGRMLAAGLFAYVNASCLYLIGTYDPTQREKGAMSQLMWQAILRARAKKCQIFDFEGSMIASIEGFFRKFGASPETYFEISKNTLPLPLRWMEK